MNSPTIETISRTSEGIERLRQYCDTLALTVTEPIEHHIDPAGEPLTLCLARLVGGTQWAVANHERLGLDGIIRHRCGQLLQDSHDIAVRMLKLAEAIA